MSTNFLTRSRHKYIYYFRRRIPLDLKHHFTTDLLLKSLNTSNKKIAVILARNLASQTDRLFGQIREMKKNNNGDLLNYTVKIKFKDSEVTLSAEPHETESILPVIDRLMSSNSVINTASTAPLSSATIPITSKIFQDYIDEYYENADLKPSTKANYKSKLEFARDHFGHNSSVLDITQPNIVSISALIKTQIRNETTQGLYIQIIVTFINWHRSRQGLSALNSKTLIPTRKTPEQDDRDEFTLSDMEAIFRNAFTYSKSEPHKWWSTIAVAFLGCRIEEICQVNVHTDLIHDNENDVWYFKIDEKPDSDGVVRKSLKKLASWRNLPIHSALVKHGFIIYLKNQKKLGKTRPFEAGWQPRTVHENQIIKWSQYTSKWGGRELDKLVNLGAIAHGEKTYFHSMRHTFAKLMINARVSSEISEAIAGRSAGAGEQERYGKIKNNYVLLYSDGIEKALTPLVKILEAVVDSKN